MFEKSLSHFLLFLRREYFPKVTQLKFEASVYKFESPLNFLMLKTDFKKFIEHFYQAQSLLSYALMFQMDALFTLKSEDD